MQAISIKYQLISLNKLKKLTNAPANIIDFLNMHINRIKEIMTIIKIYAEK